MKLTASYPKSFPAILAIITVIWLTACVTTRSLPPETVKGIPEKKVVYHFHAGENEWIVYPVRGDNRTFTGIIVEKTNMKRNKLTGTHIYAAEPRRVVISDERLTCPFDNIDRVENHRVRAGTVITTIVLAGGLFLLPVIL